jgi:ribonuclease PH
MEVVEGHVDVRFGTQRRCDGSATVKIGASEAVAGVFGPLEARTSNLVVEGQLEVSFKRLGLAATNQEEEAEMSLLIKESLETCIKHIPRTVISLSVRVLAEEGAGLTAAFMACVACLINAGIPLLKLPIAVEGILSGDNSIMYEPALLLIPSASAKFLFVYRDEKEGPTSIVLSGRCPRKRVLSLVDSCRGRAQEYRQILVHAAKKHVESDGDLMLQF